MKTFVKRWDKNRELIIVFGAWGTDHNAFLPLCSDDHDIILCYNYSADVPLILTDFKKYDRIILIAWSLGIWAAEYFAPLLDFKPDLSIAVNGTPLPAHDTYGIPLNIFEGTLENISEEGMEKYYLRIFGTKAVYEDNIEKISKRSVASLSFELRWLYNRIMETPDRGFDWTYAITCSEDRIFPFENMVKYWNTRQNSIHVSLDMPHYPFHIWKSFREMITYLEGYTDKTKK